MKWPASKFSVHSHVGSRQSLAYPPLRRGLRAGSLAEQLGQNFGAKTQVWRKDRSSSKS